MLISFVRTRSQLNSLRRESASVRLRVVDWVLQAGTEVCYWHWFRVAAGQRFEVDKTRHLCGAVGRYLLFVRFC